MAMASCNLEYHIATVSDELDIHWSDMIWGDGYSPGEVMNIAREGARAANSHPGRLEIFGPFTFDYNDELFGENFS